MKFSDENKTVREFTNNYFDYGVHNVLIGEVELGQTDAGKEYIEITVVDPGNAEITDSARVWFTSDKAANYSFNVLRTIFVHNTPEARKDEARDIFDRVQDTETLVQIMQGVKGKECWFTKYQDPERTYTAQDGTQRKSVNKNVMGYAPKLKPELIPAPRGGEEITTDNLDKIFPGAKEVPFESASDKVPTDWA